LSARKIKSLQKPRTFLKARVHDLDLEPGLTGLCVGYEDKKWRCSQLVDHSMDWLPEFALKASELYGMGSHNCIDLIRNAARKIYKSKKFRNRGEFGELLLHIAIRQVFDSIPAISKIYYKSARNDTVKGFDAVHVVATENEFELWLGEAKFYKNATKAIGEVVTEIAEHTDFDYLRDEFILISDKIDRTSDFAEELKELLSKNTSLDEVFARACIPVFITYDSDCVNSHVRTNKSYASEFAKEVRKVYRRFARKELPMNIRVHLFLMPLSKKEELVEALNKKLKTWQEL
jgi:hypothetical protein